MSNVNIRLYKTVSPSSEEKNEQTPGNGVNVYIYEVCGNGVHNNNVKVELSFGSDILFCTHGDSLQKDADINIVGDGETKLTLLLKNDSESSETFGGYYKASCWGC